MSKKRTRKRNGKKRKKTKKRERKKNQKKILIVYDPCCPQLKSLAENVYKGAASVGGVSIKIKSVKKVSKNELLKSDAIIVGSPVYNANPSSDILNFIFTWPHTTPKNAATGWKVHPMRNKIGAVFVTAGGISAGEEVTQMSIIHAMLIYGMIIVGGRGWRSPFGSSLVTTELDLIKEIKYFNKKAFRLGNRVAIITKNLKKI